MDPQTAELQRVRQILERIAASSTFQQAKDLFDAGLRYYKSENLELSVSCFEAAFELKDPFYSANALMLLGTIYRKVGDTKKEENVVREVTLLEEQSRRFLSRPLVASAYLKTGNLTAAKEQLNIASSFGRANDPSVQSGLMEILMLEHQFADSVSLAEKVAARPEPAYQILGRLYKGASLWFLNKRSESEQEIVWIANYLLSLGSVPQDLSWDFRDSEVMLKKVDSPKAQLVIQVLTQSISFDDFRSKWSELHPPIKEITLKL